MNCNTDDRRYTYQYGNQSAHLINPRYALWETAQSNDRSQVLYSIHFERIDKERCFIRSIIHNSFCLLNIKRIRRDSSSNMTCKTIKLLKPTPPNFVRFGKISKCNTIFGIQTVLISSGLLLIDHLYKPCDYTFNIERWIRSYKEGGKHLPGPVLRSYFWSWCRQRKGCIRSL